MTDYEEALSSAQAKRIKRWTVLIMYLVYIVATAAFPPRLTPRRIFAWALARAATDFAFREWRGRVAVSHETWHDPARLAL
jgi:hypothetical protein